MDKVIDGATFYFTIRKDQSDKLENLLALMEQQGAASNSIFPMAKAPSLHYGSWVILPEEQRPGGKLLPPHLLFLTTYSGSIKNHIAELAAVSPPGLHDLLSCCEEYNESQPDESLLRNCLKKRRIFNFVYNAYQYTTSEEILKEGQLREAIESYLDESMKQPAFTALNPAEIRNNIQQFVKGRPDLQWAVSPWKPGLYNVLKLKMLWYLLSGAFVIGVLSSILSIFFHHEFFHIAAFVFWLIILSLIILLVILRINERRNDNVGPPSDDFIHEVTKKETYMVTNEMTVAGPLKKGWIRPTVLFILLKIAKCIRPYSFIPTVQTSRWLQVDHGRRIVFIACFDNTSEGYAKDFVDSKNFTRRVNLLFGHGYGFPTTKWAIHEGGGKSAQGYIDAVRRQQKITRVWYSTHQPLSILNVTNNRNIRKGLFTSLKDDEVVAWLKYF